MPRLSVVFIRTALLYLAAGFTFGALLLFHKGVPLSPTLWRILPMHIEFVLIGWTLQLAMGVAFWILPRWGAERGNETPVWIAYILLNAGVLAAGVGGWLGWPPAVLLAGRAAELLAAISFAIHAWPRVKPLGG